MKTILFLFILFPFSSYALHCDCEVNVFSPMTGPHIMPPTVFKKYEVYEYSNYAIKNQIQCRSRCEDKFQDDMPTNRLSALLINYSQKLIEEGVVGHNCTGLTTLKYPVRVRAKLGDLPLGNVVDIVQVINHEEVCF